ncbi:MAG TPA: hypothetical protein VLB90_03865, partial [Pseudomonadales bacterium]|nr:hypothetical protein [Pseudomonadales bacterium]
ARGRTGFENCDYQPTQFLRTAWSLCSTVDSSTIDIDRFKGKAFGEELRRLRIAAVQTIAQPEKN